MFKRILNYFRTHASLRDVNDALHVALNTAEYRISALEGALEGYRSVVYGLRDDLAKTSARLSEEIAKNAPPRVFKDTDQTIATGTPISQSEQKRAASGVPQTARKPAVKRKAKPNA